MARRILSTRRLLFAVGLIGGLYAWWVGSQYQQLAALNQRELADTALELKNAIETAFQNVQLYDPKGAANPACEFDLDQPYLELETNCNTVEATRWVKPRMLLAGRGVQVEADPDPEDLKAPVTADSKTPVTFRFRTDVLLAELAFTARFERILLVDGAGKVLYQEDPAVLRRLRLLRWAERGFRDAQAAQPHGLRVQNMSELLGKDAVPSWARLTAVSDRTTAQFGGARYHLYTHPVAIESGSGSDLVLVGLVPVAEVLRQALAFDTYLFAFLLFIALVGGLGFPFVKLLSLDPHERFRMRDIKWLYVSSAALLTVFAFAVLAADGYTRWKHAADRGLEQLAHDVERRMLGEIADLRATLTEHDRAAARLWPGPKCDATMPVAADWYNNVAKVQALGFPRNDLVYLEQMAWVDPKGTQIWKITSDHIGEKVGVARRPYFRAVRDGNLFEIASPGRPFFIGPDRSITDGKFYTFLSTRSRLTTVPCPDPKSGSAAAPDEHVASGPDDDGVAAAADPYVVVATARLLSLDRPPLPDGWGLAVITREGRVLYHSDRRLSLRENFFDQLSQGAAARGLVYGGQSDLIASRYRETPHRIYFHRLGIHRPATSSWAADLAPDVTGLYLAAFRDVSIEQAVISRAFLVGLLGPFLWLVAVIVAGIWATGFVAKRLGVGRDDWLWPHGTYEPLYRRQALAYGLVIVTCFVLDLAGAGGWAYVALPVLMIASGLVAYARDEWHKVPRTALVRPRWHVVQFSLLGLGVILVPASAMFGVTLRHEFGTVIDTEQRWMTDQIEEIHSLLEADARADRVPVTIGTQAAVARHGRLGVWPEPFNAALEPMSGATLGLVSAHEWLDQLVPFDNERVARLRYQGTTVQYAPPGIWESGSVGWVGVVGLVFLAGALVGWVRWSSTHLLYADRHSTPELHPNLVAAAWDVCSVDEKHVLMHILDEGIANPRQQAAVTSLMEKGLVRLRPRLELSSPQLAELVCQARRTDSGTRALNHWERVHDGHNWHDTRLVLVIGLGVIAILVATQPGLPSELAAVASGITAIGGAGLKVRETVTAWLAKSRKS
jgi:hypothetical protein